MTELAASGRLRIAIDLADLALADRISSSLADVEGLELVSAEDAPDAMIVAPSADTRQPEFDVQLTGREIEVLSLLAEGASNKLIGRRLGISTHTAKYHVSSLLDKLDAISRTDAVAIATKLRMIKF